MPPIPQSDVCAHSPNEIFVACNWTWILKKLVLYVYYVCFYVKNCTFEDMTDKIFLLTSPLASEIAVSPFPLPQGEGAIGPCPAHERFNLFMYLLK